MTSTMSQRGAKRGHGRDEALRQLVPKMLSILGEERGFPPTRGGQVKLGENVELSARGLGSYRWDCRAEDPATVT